MLAFRIVNHSIRQIICDVPVMLRLLWAPVGLHVLAVYILFNAGERQLLLREFGDPFPPETASREVLLLLLFFLLVMWLAVSFHRFILREEEPSVVPALSHETRSYLARSILIVVMAILLVIPVAISGAIIAGIAETSLGPHPVVSFLVITAPILLVEPVILRWSAGLPGIALGEENAFKKGEASLAGHYWLLLWVTVIVSVIGYIVHLLVVLPGLPVLYYIASNWFSTLLNLSVLTTLWGYFVEGRELH
ncbi:hypothetical protein [Paracoccus alkanivorans]|uniref:DUF4013 domain-containing protein n=1 Tax=Paracoccus alkanivorans TaxID=2116655 RepID=A0A3M0MAJ5_9RHOB|nr:hypothetical protein [Paracoccus alkanivorans]RMC34315.1 hypothetical protein C9E81_14265 [Paracoccus alkanivorans]